MAFASFQSTGTSPDSQETVQEGTVHVHGRVNQLGKQNIKLGVLNADLCPPGDCRDTSMEVPLGTARPLGWAQHCAQTPLGRGCPWQPWGSLALASAGLREVPGSPFLCPGQVPPTSDLAPAPPPSEPNYVPNEAPTSLSHGHLSPLSNMVCWVCVAGVW